MTGSNPEGNLHPHKEGVYIDWLLSDQNDLRELR